MMESLKELLTMVKFARDDELLMSRKHCHAKNVSSIVVQNSQGRLLRAFLAHDGHRLNTNTLQGELEVGIHNHVYDIAIRGIAGNYVRNRTYKVCEWDNPDFKLYGWTFKSGVGDGKPDVTPEPMQALRCDSGTILDADTWLCMEADTLHDIDCKGLAAWWVREGFRVRDSTTLYTKSPEVSCTGLYEPFKDRYEVAEHVYDFCKLFE